MANHKVWRLLTWNVQKSNSVKNFPYNAIITASLLILFIAMHQLSFARAVFLAISCATRQVRSCRSSFPRQDILERNRKVQEATWWDRRLLCNSRFDHFPPQWKPRMSFQMAWIGTIAPIHVSGIRLGSLIIWRNDREFLDDISWFWVRDCQHGGLYSAAELQRKRGWKEYPSFLTVTMAVNTVLPSQSQELFQLFRASSMAMQRQHGPRLKRPHAGLPFSQCCAKSGKAVGIIGAALAGDEGNYLKAPIQMFWGN